MLILIKLLCFLIVETLNFLRHDIAATCVLKVPLNPNQPTNQPLWKFAQWTFSAVSDG